MREIVAPSPSLLDKMNRIIPLWKEWLANPAEHSNRIPSLILGNYWRQDQTLSELKDKLHSDDMLLIGGKLQAMSATSVTEESFVYMENFLERPELSIADMMLSNEEFNKLVEEQMKDTQRRGFTQFARDNGFLFSEHDCVSLANNPWNVKYDGSSIFPTHPVSPWSGNQYAGGNFVTNGGGSVISCGKEFPPMFKYVANGLYISKMICTPPHPKIIPHSDVQICWLDHKTLAINDPNTPGISAKDATFFNQLQTGLSRALRDVTIVLLPFVPDWNPRRTPTAISTETKRNISLSSCVSGIYVQCLVTPYAFYLPTYGADLEESDEQALQILRNAVAGGGLNKEVISINCRDVAMMGGSLHCLFTQLEGKHAIKFLEELRTTLSKMRPFTINFT